MATELWGLWNGFLWCCIEGRRCAGTREECEHAKARREKEAEEAFKKYGAKSSTVWEIAPFDHTREPPAKEGMPSKAQFKLLAVIQTYRTINVFGNLPNRATRNACFERGWYTFTTDPDGDGDGMALTKAGLRALTAGLTKYNMSEALEDIYGPHRKKEHVPPVQTWNPCRARAANRSANATVRLRPTSCPSATSRASA